MHLANDMAVRDVDGQNRKLAYLHRVAELSEQQMQASNLQQHN